MNIQSTAFLLLAQAATAAAAVPAAAAPAGPWWREPWAAWLISLATVVGPTVLAWLTAKQLRFADSWGRLATVLVALTAGAVITALGWPPRLGIDLKGGVILVYEVDAAGQSAGQVGEVAGRIEQLIATEQAASGSRVSVTGNRITVRLTATDAVAREALEKGIGGLDFGEAGVRRVGRKTTGDTVELDYDVAGGAAAVDMDKLVAAVSRRVNPGGQKEVTVRRYGLDQIEVIIPDVEQSEVDYIKGVVSSAGVLEFRITANPENPQHKRAIELGTLSAATTVGDGGRAVGRWVQLDVEKFNPLEQRDLVTRTMPDGRVQVLVLLDRFNVTGGLLSRASSSYDGNGQPCVNFSFKAEGAPLFGTLTGKNLPDPANRLTSRLGIVLDDVLISAPTLRSAITSDGQITGGFSQAEVDRLVGVLNAGSLPAALVKEPISEQKISPQLGADTIRSGARAMILATIVVLTFMLAYYRFSGLVADLAVLLNILLVVALMISIKAAFTLAGLAGLVLSVGMAVDANVLIYERMREETERGSGVRMAIRNGFQRAFSTIVDSNLTTLITAVVLFAMGTDQLKGFAVTLILGLVLNLFTAVFCARVIFDLAERNGWLRRIEMAKLFGTPNFEFVKYVKPAILASLAFILLGLFGSWLRGPGLFDIDFTGGTSVQVAFRPDRALDIADVRKAVRDLPDAAVSAVTSAGVQPGLQYKIDTSIRDAEQVEKTLREVFPDRLRTYSMGYGEVVSSAKEGEKPDAAALTTAVALDFPEKINLPTLKATIQEALAAEGAGEAVFELEPDAAEVQAAPGRMKPKQKWSLSTALDVPTTRKVVERVARRLVETPVYLSANSIGGKVAGNTQVTAVWALVASLIMIVLYVWVRFQNVAFGLAAVVALIHDVLVAVACLALSSFVAPSLGWALVDDFKISLDVVAALLTIVGFSINDTIVIFDRLRELRGKSPLVTAEMVDKAVNQTLSRTILTSGTAFLATLILYLFGGQGIHAFAFTMLVGIITGTYSTIYIASPLVLWLQEGAFGGRRAPTGVRPQFSA